MDPCHEHNRKTSVLFVNACVNQEKSRTYRLAKALISHIPDATVETVDLEKLGLKGLDSDRLAQRNKAVSEGDFSDPSFAYAKQILDADYVILASPFWESSFNSFMKTYLENISVPGLVFNYNDQGIPVGKCKGRLIYVTTRGGPVSDESDLGYAIIKQLSKMYGFKRTDILSASDLDIVGNDVEQILDEAIGRIDNTLYQ